MECTAKTTNGENCSAHSLRGKPYCFAHDPDNAAARDLARKRGGRARGTQLVTRFPMANEPPWVPLTDLVGARAAFGWIAGEVIVGRLEPRAANAAVGAINAMVAVIREVDFEARLSRIEKREGSHNP